MYKYYIDTYVDIIRDLIREAFWSLESLHKNLGLKESCDDLLESAAEIYQLRLLIDDVKCIEGTLEQAKNAMNRLIHEHSAMQEVDAAFWSEPEEQHEF